MIKHDFDWSKAPEPWCWVGPEIAAKLKQVALMPRSEYRDPDKRIRREDGTIAPLRMAQQ